MFWSKFSYKFCCSPAVAQKGAQRLADQGTYKDEVNIELQTIVNTKGNANAELQSTAITTNIFPWSFPRSSKELQVIANTSKMKPKELQTLVPINRFTDLLTTLPHCATLASHSLGSSNEAFEVYCCTFLTFCLSLAFSSYEEKRYHSQAACCS